MSKIRIKNFSHIALALSTLLLFVSTGCHKHDESIHPPVSDVDVYAVGSDSYGPKLWKNGTVVSLGAGNSATDITISGNDVYVSGYGENSNHNFIAKYWINGIVVNLSDGARYAFAEGIAVHGNDVYVAGREVAPGKSTYIAKYWKNGIAVPLSDANENASLADIAVSGNDVYAIGKHNQDGQPSVACYWKNGQLTDLSDETTNAEDQAITVAGDDIYMMWSASYNDSGRSQTSYCKNFGPSVKLIDAAKNFHGYSIAASANDVYVAGYGISSNGSAFAAEYFKNGVPVLVTNGPESDYATDIIPYGNDIYVAGWTENVGAGKYPTACYWKNGTKVLLGDGLSQSLAKKILIIKKNSPELTPL